MSSRIDPEIQRAVREALDGELEARVGNYLTRYLDSKHLPSRSQLPQKIRPVGLDGSEVADGDVVAYDATNELVTFAKSPGYYSCYLYNPDDGTDAIIPNTTATTLEWNTEWYDFAGMYDHATAPTQIFFPVPGLYMVTLCIGWGALGSSNEYYGAIQYYNSSDAYVDGWHQILTEENSAVVGHKISQTVPIYVPDSAGYNDGGAYVIAQVYQSSGGNRTLTTGVGDTFISANCVYLV